MIGESGPLLKISAAGFSWGVPLGAIERVTQAKGTSIDSSGMIPQVTDDEGPAPLFTLESSLEVAPYQRILWMRQADKRLALIVDEVSGHMEDAPFHALPTLPFARRPPILGLAGVEGDTLVVLDLENLGHPASPTLPPAMIDPAETTAAGTASLMFLPPLGGPDSDLPIVPALSAAQVLGFESAGELTPLPGLPPWCLGIGWWRGAPVAIFDLAGRLSSSGGKKAERRRWLLAAVPGGDHLGLALDGSCSPGPLPERASVVPAQGPLADAIYGLFQTEERQLALLDLQRWRVAGF